MNLDYLKLERGYYYLASPYSRYPDGIEGAFEDVCSLAGALIAAGVCVYSPIAHTHPIAKFGRLDPYSHALWLPLDEQMMEHAHGIIVAEFTGWHESKGIQHEVDWFEARGRPVIGLPYVEIARICFKHRKNAT